MDDLLAKAIERRDKLLAELAVLNHFIESYEKTMTRQESPATSPTQLPLWAGQSGSRARHAAEVKQALDAAEEIILQAGRPMTRGQLVPMLLERGFKIAGSDKVKVFGTNIWRSGRFDHIKEAGYWPKGHPFPENLF